MKNLSGRFAPRRSTAISKVDSNVVKEASTSFMAILDLTATVVHERRISTLKFDLLDLS
jgi:hypothetical protein